MIGWILLASLCSFIVGIFAGFVILSMMMVYVLERKPQRFDALVAKYAAKLDNTGE